ncbi:MAG TPA: dihydrodipicolinate synthase family protein [Chloroflexota bacterium]|nr:dihydrodipicolinate synthase family protein [Chloroflexota bacterium]
MLYTKSEAKDWARAHMRGVCNVIIPSYTHHLKRLNEKAIRHDVRQNIAHKFWGALLVSEAGTTLDEMRQFMEIAVDEARGRHHFLLHGTFDTAEDTVAMCKAAEQIGVSGLLLGYPNSFYPRTARDIYDYSAYVCNSTDLGVVLFAAGHWNFGRIHPSGFPPDVLVELADLPNVVAIKHEVARPGVAGFHQFWKMARDKQILVSDPLEANSPLWVDLFGMQWMGTSNYEWWGPRVPEYFAHLQDGDYDQAMAIYWQIQPARAARMAEQATFSGANFIHRYLWKYQAWLTGYNGGPLRQPAMKLADAPMRRLREALQRSQVPCETADIAEFFVGRNPE